jgi:lysophospholipase L1-like esterase
VAVFTRYVALGDSFTEGVGDPHPSSPNGWRGWADHVAVALAQTNPELRYANLAVCGSRMDEILEEQIHTAAMFEPDLVTIYAGMNNLLLLRNDVDAMMARYAESLKKLQQTGATVLAFTAADLGTVPLFRRLRGRAAVYNELLRGIADDLDLELVDFWRFSEFRDSRLWDGDRIHLSPLGHERFAAKVLDTLAVSHGLTTRSAALLQSVPPVWDLRANLRWTAAFAAPYVAKRMRLAKRGARAGPKLTSLTKVL